MAQRQFSTSDTSAWNYKYGDGSDGALTISTNTTFSTANQSCSGTIDTTALTLNAAGTFSNNDFVLIQQSRGTGVGVWELNRISSGAGSTSLTMESNLTNTYTDSGASQAQILKLSEYSGVTVNGSVTWSVPSWDQNTGGILAFLCNGTTTITGTIEARGNNATYDVATVGRGFRGGAGGMNNNVGTQGEGTSGLGTTSTAANGSGGGAGDADGGGVGGGGGGNASSGGSGGGSGGTPGTGGAASGANTLVTMTFGGGGGGGGSNSGTVGSGGAGGAIAIIISRTISITGSVLADGGNGQQHGDASGAGGAGGSVLLKGQNVTVGTNLITALAGSGGGGAGANGSDGRIAIYYGASLSGTTNPAAYTAQDGALNFGRNRAVFIG